MQYACKAVVGVSRYDERNLKLEKITRHVNCIYNGICPVEFDCSLSFHLPIKYMKTILCIARLSPQKIVVFLCQLLHCYQIMLLYGLVINRK